MTKAEVTTNSTAKIDRLRDGDITRIIALLARQIGLRR
jgi:hypothetical protein